MQSPSLLFPRRGALHEVCVKSLKRSAWKAGASAPCARSLCCSKTGCEMQSYLLPFGNTPFQSGWGDDEITFASPRSGTNVLVYVRSLLSWTSISQL